MYARYNGYKCADCDYIASTEDEMKEHIKKKHKNALTPQDLIGKRLLIRDEPLGFDFALVRDYDPKSERFYATTYMFDLSNGCLSRRSITLNYGVDVIIRYINNIVTEDELKDKIDVLCENAKEVYLKSRKREIISFAELQKV